MFLADGKQLTHHGAADELGNDLQNSDRREQPRMVCAVYQGRGESLQGRLFAFTQTANEQRWNNVS